MSYKNYKFPYRNHTTVSYNMCCFTDRKDSPYHLDTLDTLFNMQEEGKIRSITGLNFPPNVLRDAHENGFTLDSNQVACNIIDQRSISDYQSVFGDTNTKMLYSDPLLGGILTEPFFFNHRKEPSPLTLSQSQRQNLNIIRTWGKSVFSRERVPSWTLFHKHILSTLYEISNLYEVTIQSVALRYIMQKTSDSSIESSALGGMVIGSRVGVSEEWFDTRPNQWREVFRFQLDQEHMKQLDEVSTLGFLPELYPSTKKFDFDDFDY